MSAEGEVYRLLSADGVTVTAPKNVVLQSQMLKNLLEVASAEEEITLDSVHSEDLKHILEYCEYHAKSDNDSSVPEADKQDWDQKFVQKVTANNDQHLRMLVNADKLIIPSLFKLLVRAAVAKLHNKTAKEIRADWGIAADLTKEEEDEVLGTTSWLYAAKKD
ncbi:uncharacterized protein MONOS_6325 [Monocercomonoides exilis]|uniref:uncharacterized protein n=1 Tax=Monocercomonoides exilis TaxID=2049356 RepID=UPI003559EAB0|nr:hypothetical protein MONOS_6325 [Monocercomonoides exilis]|eukprot:MONOS_6325.1-p1 / transcript=MONOS_6325.1 / gene=MONOS_6325 / organism=Monocercomonoides_exilis_PA203 / gene_product=unspecified product / transcript_product=unspecified product / location=Mono_scaffold00197:82750-83238(-) / protein_length=162 / sequence_SO=supercontig / SO=protein_coding / is_pseudo=false